MNFRIDDDAEENELPGFEDEEDDVAGGDDVIEEESEELIVEERPQYPSGGAGVQAFRRGQAPRTQRRESWRREAGEEIRAQIKSESETGQKGEEAGLRNPRRKPRSRRERRSAGGASRLLFEHGNPKVRRARNMFRALSFWGPRIPAKELAA